MNLGFAFLDRRRRSTSQEMGAIQPEDYVVARWVNAAPSAWVFFDGSETILKDKSGAPMMVPGGAFFLDEARAYASAEQASAQAQRLNALAVGADESWVAIAARRVIAGLKGFTPVVAQPTARGRTFAR